MRVCATGRGARPPRIGSRQASCCPTELVEASRRPSSPASTDWSDSEFCEDAAAEEAAAAMLDSQADSAPNSEAEVPPPPAPTLVVAAAAVGAPRSWHL